MVGTFTHHNDLVFFFFFLKVGFGFVFNDLSLIKLMVKIPPCQIRHRGLRIAKCVVVAS